MNSDKEDIGVLLNYELDLAVGADENNFECRIQNEAHCCGSGFYLYIEGTEYGGIVDNIESDTRNGEVAYSGRTWQGILNSKVIEPDAGQDYLVLSGEANSVIASLISRLGLSDLFEASTEDSGLTIRNYYMNRYIEGYYGINKMLSSAKGKLRFLYKNRKVILSAVEKADYSVGSEFTSSQVAFMLRKKYHTVNHLICLGSGELAARMVIHLYTDAEGNISETQTQFGLEEYTAVFDYPNVGSEEDLKNSGIEELKSLWQPDEILIDFDNTSDSCDVGDIVGAVDEITGVSVTSEITKKIVTIKNGQATISYKVGE